MGRPPFSNRGGLDRPAGPFAGGSENPPTGEFSDKGGTWNQSRRPWRSSSQGDEYACRGRQHL